MSGNDWAALPLIRRLLSVIPTARDHESTVAVYDRHGLLSSWMTREFDDREWKQGLGGFGTPGTPGAQVRTIWNGPEIWLRRDLDIPQEAIGADPSTLRLIVHHDEDAEIYLNGVLAARVGGLHGRLSTSTHSARRL